MRTRLARVLAAIAVVVGLATPAAAGPAVTVTGPCGSVSVADARQTDDSGPFVFTATVTAPSGCKVQGSVNYRTSDGAENFVATAPEDYATTSNTLTWSDASSKTIAVPVVRDGVGEKDEQFSLQLDNPVGLTITGRAAIGTILGSPPNDAATISAVDGSPKCWNSPPALFLSTTGACMIGVHLTGFAPNGVQVHWLTVDNGGPNLGYVPVKDAVLTIQPNQPRGDIVVQLDNPNQRQFQFQLRIFAPSTGVLGNATSVVSVTPNG